jgi:hypothetical protein
MSRQYQRPLRRLLLLCGLSISFTLFGGMTAHAQDASAVNASQTSDDPVTYPENEEPNEVPGDNSIKPQPVSPEHKRALQRRAGEQVGDNPRGSAVVLGMHIQEVDNERAKVVEVAPASPAFDAGIRKGDEIVSFDGFKATNYREWIDGMRRLATDAPDGDTLPIALVRDNKQLNLRVRVPIAKAGAPPATGDVTLNQTVVPSEGGQPGVAIGGQSRPFPYGGAYGGDTLIADSFGEEFNSPDGENAGRAIAEIVRLDVPHAAAAATGTPGGQPQPRGRERTRRAGGGQVNAGARVGLAGFRDDANGMFVMLDVGGLLPGNYHVGIDDPSILASGGTTEGGLPNQPPVNRNRRAQARPGRIETVPTPVPPPPTPIQRNGAAPAGQQPPPTQQPTAPARTGGTPQSRSQSFNRTAEIPRTVLAQVTDSSAAAGAAGNIAPPPEATSDLPATGQARPLTTPATGNAQPVDAPATGEVNPVEAVPTGVSGVEDPRQAPDTLNNSGVQAGVAGGVGPTLPIGTLTIDQSGTGRLAQVVESVRVQDILGQAIVIYSQRGNQQATLPPNLDAGADPLAGTGGRRAPAGGSGTESRPAGAVPQPGTSNAAPGISGVSANGVNRFQGIMPVAGGMIRSMSDWLPQSTSSTAADQEVPTTQSPNNSRNVPQNSAVPAGAGQRRVR